LRLNVDPPLMQQLIECIQTEIPILERTFGAGLEPWITYWTYYLFVHGQKRGPKRIQEPNRKVRRKFLEIAKTMATELPAPIRLLPDNPATLQPDGQILTPPNFWDDPRTTRWSRESRNLIRALRPEGRRGRPKTQKSAKPSKRALDPILAQRAY